LRKFVALGKIEDLLHRDKMKLKYWSTEWADGIGVALIMD